MYTMFTRLTIFLALSGMLSAMELPKADSHDMTVFKAMQLQHKFLGAGRDYLTALDAIAGYEKFIDTLPYAKKVPLLVNNEYGGVTRDTLVVFKWYALPITSLEAMSVLFANAALFKHALGSFTTDEALRVKKWQTSDDKDVKLLGDTLALIHEKTGNHHKALKQVEESLITLSLPIMV